MKKGFAPVLVVIIIILILIPIAYFLNKQFLGYRLPWEQKPFHDGNICGDGKITFGECPNPSPIGISGNPETLLLDVSSDGKTITTKPGTIIDVKLNGGTWTKPVSSDNSVVSTIEASASSDGSATGKFRVVKQGIVTLTAEGSCGKASPGYSVCNHIRLWKVTIMSSNATSDETANPDLIGANWKTYDDQRLAISILYPSKWKVESLGNEGGSDFPNNPTVKVKFSDPVIDGTIFISLYPNPQNLSLGDYIAMQAKKEVDYEKVNGPNAGNPYILPTGSQPSKLPNGLAANLKVNDGCEPFSCTTYIVSRPKAFYTITFWEQTNKDIVNKMLTSLQFTN